VLTGNKKTLSHPKRQGWEIFFISLYGKDNYLMFLVNDYPGYRLLSFLAKSRTITEKLLMRLTNPGLSFTFGLRERGVLSYGNDA